LAKEMSLKQRETTPRPAPALGGICTLLVLGLLVGASLSAVQPGIRDLGRDIAGNRDAVRHLSESVAKAFRSIVGDQTKPSLHTAPAFRADTQPRAFALAAPSALLHEPRPPRLRAELLNLPPPAML
jgi:hypothetical protein